LRIDVAGQPAPREIPLSNQGDIFPEFGTRFAEPPSVRLGSAMEGMDEAS
jgi:hypothetical protein